MGRLGGRKKHGPEWYIQRDLIEFMVDRGWYVKRMHGNLYQTGVPDLLCLHKKWGTRWIDVKQPNRYTFTKDQRREWPIWDEFRTGIWILTAATQEQYDLLFQPPNWRNYWKPSWGIVPDIDELLAQLEQEDAD
jgi:hypothetical protein